MPGILRTALALPILLLTFPSMAATLSLPTINASPGESLQVEVSFDVTSSEQVAGIQFDLLFQASAMSITAIEAGSSAIEAGKMLSSNPVATGQQRVIIAGLNQTPMQSGPVAIVKINMANGVSPGSYPLSLEALVLSDPGGRRVNSTATPGAIMVPGDLPPPPPGGCACADGKSGPGKSGDLPQAVGVVSLLLLAHHGRRRLH